MNKWLGSGRLTDNPVLKYDSDRAVMLRKGYHVDCEQVKADFVGE